jgi:hypothetical protein
MTIAPDGDTPDDVARFIDAVNALDDESDFIRWATFEDMVDIWRTEYREQASVWTGFQDPLHHSLAFNHCQIRHNLTILLAIFKFFVSIQLRGNRGRHPHSTGRMNSSMEPRPYAWERVTSFRCFRPKTRVVRFREG